MVTIILCGHCCYLSAIGGKSSSPDEPWLDPKYLPPEPSEGAHPGGLYITPGVLLHAQPSERASGVKGKEEPQAASKKSAVGGLKPTMLTSSY